VNHDPTQPPSGARCVTVGSMLSQLQVGALEVRLPDGRPGSSAT
jgi:hypothetical protein